MNFLKHSEGYRGEVWIKLRDYKVRILDMKGFVERLEEEARSIKTTKIKDLFEKDAKEIAERYKKGEIQKIEAIHELERLKKFAEKELQQFMVEMDTEVEMIIKKLKGFLKPKIFGVPLEIVISEIISYIEDITRNELPKKDFGYLNVTGENEANLKEKLEMHLDEYRSGVIVSSEEFLNYIEETLENLEITFEVKKLPKKAVVVWTSKN